MKVATMVVANDMYHADKEAATMVVANEKIYPTLRPWRPEIDQSDQQVSDTRVKKYSASY
jgi:hypothetical protein